MASLIRTSSPSFISTTTETPLHKLNNLSSKAMADSPLSRYLTKMAACRALSERTTERMAELQRILTIPKTCVMTAPALAQHQGC
jgi:hypothetical protein